MKETNSQTWYPDPHDKGYPQKQSYNWVSDLLGSASGGYGSHDDPGGSCFTIDICPDLILAAIVAAAAAAAVLIFNAIVAAGRRKRRSYEFSIKNIFPQILSYLGNDLDHIQSFIF